MVVTVGTVVGCLELMIKVAAMIKKAVDTACQNKDDCQHLVRRVNTLCETVQQMEKNGDLMETAAMQRALDTVVAVLQEVLAVVNSCQKERRSGLCVFLVAGRLSRELSKVDGRITTATSDVVGAEMAFLVSQFSKPLDAQKEQISKQLSVVQSTPRTKRDKAAEMVKDHIQVTQDDLQVTQE